MKFFDKGRTKLALNLTSMIDVLFILLIFVLLSAKFEDEGGVAVDLPQGTSRELPEHQTIELVVAADSTIYLDKAVIPLDTLEKTLDAERLKAKESVVVVKADRAVPFEKIAIILDTAKRVKLQRVAFKIRN